MSPNNYLFSGKQKAFEDRLSKQNDLIQAIEGSRKSEYTCITTVHSYSNERHLMNISLRFTLECDSFDVAERKEADWWSATPKIQ